MSKCVVLSCASSIPLSQSNSDFIDPGCFAASLAQIPEPSTSRCSQPYDCLVHPVEQLKDGKNSLPSPHQRSYICIFSFHEFTSVPQVEPKRTNHIQCFSVELIVLLQISSCLPTN
ncbi:hypothetical protein RRG08_004437 [Elysia crispata]|uniref:Uncharacterized protein n=1 Tax=Elysia crispata TaxID=231223 RepID=A0AAE1E2B0_9GAST|nr:hypothetical protein RRG08_004437 [Elysia crispata]